MSTLQHRSFPKFACRQMDSSVTTILVEILGAFSEPTISRAAKLRPRVRGERCGKEAGPQNFQGGEELAAGQRYL